MKILGCLCGLALAAASPHAGAQMPPVDYIQINDPRIFDLSDDGLTYSLVDGPVATGNLSLVQGPVGSLVGSITIDDIYGNTFGPIPVNGRLKVSSSAPLTMALSGRLGAQAQVKITGKYNSDLKMMNVKVYMQAPGVAYEWNDSFIPTNAESTGLTLERESTLLNKNGAIVGMFEIEAPGFPDRDVLTRDRQVSTSPRFVVERAGSSVHGSYNELQGIFVPSVATTTLGYGTIFTPGSLIHMFSSYLFPRN